MKASETNFLKFLQGTKQFIIPIYQRKYSWTINQCKQLWNDILRAAHDENIKGHFVGSVVYVEKGIYQISSIPQLLVIDGQQRLTTLSLLLRAFAKVIEERNEEFEMTKKKLINYYLVNNEEEGDLYHKLVLTQTDKETLIRLIEDKELPTAPSQRIIENYNYFLDEIRKENMSLSVLFHGLMKLIVVDISLDRDHDNPQLIFESLNSTGLDLSQADLIRNYVLMGLEPREQNELYQNYWYPMEQAFGTADTEVFDRFIRDYLTLKKGRIPNKNNVYADFKLFVYSQEGRSLHEIVKDIYRYSKYFAILNFQQDPDKEITEALKDINALRVEVSYPFLLEVYDDYAANKIGKQELLFILRLVESYVFRRAICGVPTSSLNKTFATLSKEIDKDHYLESIQAAFLLKNSYKRMPNDEEFIREFVVKDIYNFRSRNYLLRKLENDNRKEIVNIESYTIEHIMPQNENLSSEWRQELGSNWEEVHKTYLHTIGNLTLTRYNSELSDKPFKVKRDQAGGFADSPLRLNRELAQLHTWNEAEIRKRAMSLAEQARHVWKLPHLDADVLLKYTKKGTEKDKIYSLADHAEYLQGDMLKLFEQLRTRICNLDSSIREEFKKLYIAYKATTNFVDIVPQKSRLRLSLNLAFHEINDPRGICKDVTNLGRWGNGDVEVGISSIEELDYIMFLIEQAFEKQVED
ncbi:DUF262 and DUF1524 domain-containing protein [Paenibacillus thiaminolyticus]|uniref:DUF262 and DUF1524 domain-containing protein n=1 Tax=Paenibacillus thiaminolyticus TaxID=49283 RepID=UPI002542FE94|nr:DUF262 and DUF1524 domain-containing protein [Paenibacillus thiaminolyticus]WII36243.1 DUF262 and DUF1524 domain-containing protein [Paenibacillus thiaminolyticus]